MSNPLLTNTQSNLKVLVAEDNRINQKILKELLRKEGLEATIVANGKEVLTMLNQQHFDLLILDFQMPELNGLDTLKAIRAHTETSINSIRVILFTAEKDKQQIQDMQAYDIDYMLQKPINQAEFSQVLKQVDNTSVKLNAPQANSSMDYLLGITSGNKELMTELMNIFIEEVPEALKQIKVFYLKENWPSVQKLAHKLTSNYKYVGAEEAEDLLKALETDFGPEENKLMYGQQIENLEKITSRIIQTLQQEKQNLL